MTKKNTGPNPILENLLTGMFTMYERRDKRDRSQAQGRYLEGVRRSTETVRAIIQHGTLDDYFAAVKALLLHDLQYLSKTEARKKAILQHIKNFTDALNNLDAMANRPDEYRRQAEGYIDDYKIGGLLPKDGMHGALRSYMGHLKSRDSQYLTDEEEDFLEVQKELAAAITQRYIEMQRSILKAEE